jgi:hypothetical protein
MTVASAPGAWAFAPRKESAMKAKIVQESDTLQSRRYLVRIRTGSAEFEGLFFSPYPERRLSEVLTRMDQFINIKEARDVVSGEVFPFMVISKSSIETVKVIKEWG